MKNVHFLLSLCSALTLPAATLPEATIVERGPHHAVWQRVTEHTTPYGRKYYITNGYQEITTGKHYLKDGQWVPAVEAIEVLASGFGVATQLQHKVIFAPNINTAGAIDCLTPDEKRLRSHVLGIAYTDKISGQGVMIGTVQDCTGVLVSRNQVLYPDAFDTEGGFRADIRYTVTLGGLEQDIILVESPPDPTIYGIKPENCRLEVYSEFVEWAEPVKETVVLTREEDVQARQAMAEPDLVEEKLVFGVMRMDQGFGFRFGNSEPQTPMAKTWEQREARQLLVERVDFSSVQDELARLPQVAAVRTPKKALPLKGAGQNAWASFLPARPPREHAAVRKLRGKEMAQANLPRQGFVLDWQLLNANTNDFTFRGDTTYFVSGQVIFTGTTTIEGGTVIKCTNGTTSKRIWVQGRVDCRTTDWRPAIFTAKDDDTTGETISGSTGNPSGNTYGQMFDMTGNTNIIDLHDVRFRYAHYAINMASTGSPDLTLSHAQFSRNWAAVVNYVGQARLRNVLIHDGQYATGSGGTYRGENITVHAVQYFRSVGYTNAYLTNCLLIAVTNNVLFTGSNNETNISDSGIFQTAGHGQRYLASGSPYRDAGTTNINPGLLADLRKMTTYPPLLLTNDITVNTTLTPQVQRDTNAIDLGFHYPSADWIAGGISVTNAILTVSGGATVAIDAANTNWGIRLQSGAQVVSDGDPVNLNRFVRTHSFQEVPAGVGNSTAPLFADTHPPPASPATLKLRFTDVAQIQRHFMLNQAAGQGTLGTITLRDSQFRGGTNCLQPSLTTQYMGWTNLLVEHCGWMINSNAPTALHLRNATFISGVLDLYVAAGSAWSVKDCIFDYTSITNKGLGTLVHDYNGYLINSARLMPNGANDVVLATNTVNFQIGPLGAYYLPTNSAFIDAGSVANAAQSGFYWYTSVTNQSLEGNTRLNIGKLWIALSNGSPVDSDADGIPDYIEDANGNGITDPGETDVPRFNVLITAPDPNAILP